MCLLIHVPLSSVAAMSMITPVVMIVLQIPMTSRPMEIDVSVPIVLPCQDRPNCVDNIPNCANDSSVFTNDIKGDPACGAVCVGDLRIGISDFGSYPPPYQNQLEVGKNVGNPPIQHHGDGVGSGWETVGAWLSFAKSGEAGALYQVSARDRWVELRLHGL